MDYQDINKRTIPDHYPTPRSDDLIDMIGRCRGKVFTTLDLMKGYHQIRISSESKDKIAFTCYLQYKRMLYGLTNTPSTEWTILFVYFDDNYINCVKVNGRTLDTRGASSMTFRRGRAETETAKVCFCTNQDLLPRAYCITKRGTTE